MARFCAGFGRADITPRLGCRLMGYGNRTHGATAVHDRLLARALVVEDEGGRWALIACDLRCLNATSVAEVRSAVQQRCGIAPAHVFVATTHTHSGPHDRDAENWERPLGQLIADAVQAACAALQPARLGGGYGLLYGYSVNRRWLDRPVDPGVAVIRVETLAGEPLGLISSFGCHPVVMGYDNYAISADWPGFACRAVEQALGGDATCLFFQGGGGDVNPVVASVRAQLQSGRPVVSIGKISAYYGDGADPTAYNVGDRTGGTWADVAELGSAFADEVLRVYRGITPTVPTTPLGSHQLLLDAGRTVDEVAAFSTTATPLSSTTVPAEIMVLAAGDLLLLGQPGEVLSETVVRWRRDLRALGYATPLIVGHANGWLSYLPEPETFPEGGYEVQRAHGEGTSRFFQPQVRTALLAALAENDI
ncbi:MAG: neutral/alkaline non-lysosomal ceramidase N-terminal domain-containing protein [Caldilineaceae bacterium]|nr:neutral/alkaline non-lysosomal ceramidase N-terminal domain-containing protein [Caldilineaceae bacterium]